MIPALLFALGAVASTLAGAFLILRKESWTKQNLWRFLAFGSGMFLGVTVIHLLPEAWELDPRWAGVSALSAFIVLFALEEYTVFHACSEIVEDCEIHSMGYGALVSLALHSFAAGLAIAFSFLSSKTLGTLVSAAVIVHHFSDGLTLSSLLQAAGHSKPRTWLFTTLVALATPAGAMFGLGSGLWVTPRALAVLLGLTAGGFLYVSMMDILPRLHRRRDPLCWAFLLVGMALSLLHRHG